ncbi:MAG: hypothetical protein AAGC78_12810 [Cellvibrio sp.]|uniref:hypothetical protein n=1 Tax=Cellvibrio sp. TaxID=1965322 RepID=UPI0031ACC1E4
MSTFRIDPIFHTLDDGSEVEIYLVMGPSGVVLRSFANKEDAASHVRKLSTRLRKMTDKTASDLNVTPPLKKKA